MHLFIRIYVFVLLAVLVAFVGGVVISDWVWPRPEPRSARQADADDNDEPRRGPPDPPVVPELAEAVDQLRGLLTAGRWSAADTLVAQLGGREGYDARLIDLATWPASADDVGDFARRLVERTITSDDGFVTMGRRDVHHAWRLSAAEGRTYVLLVEVDGEVVREAWRAARERFRRMQELREMGQRAIEIAAMLLALGLVCVLITRYISSPVLKLRAVSRRIAAGELDQRSLPLIGRRRDELGELARDFDVMADRLASLVTAQQRLLRDVSHELRSPLARQALAVEMARQRADADLQPLLERVEREGTRLAAMIDELLVIARLAQQEPALAREPVELDAVVEQVADDARFEGQARDVDVVVTAEPVTVVGDAALLGRVFENVLRNAVRYTAEHTAVEVTLTAGDDQAVLIVRDHGPGVAEEELDRIFRPFHRVDEGRARESGGVGLGLAIARSIAVSHGGTIAAANHTGGGLVVTLTLPLQTDPPSV